MNNVQLTGNLTADPILNRTQAGVAVVKFTVASNRSFKKKSTGEWDERVTYVNCEAWDSGAERIADRFSKGDPILVEGSWENDNYEKDGVKIYGNKCRVSRFEKLARHVKSTTPPSPDSPPQGEPVVEANENVSIDAGTPPGDDIPF